MSVSGSASLCPRCKEATNSRNRLITDSCGHVKCKGCFLKEDVCSECHQVQQTEVSEQSEEKGSVHTRLGRSQGSHVTEVVAKDGSKQYQCTICGKTFRSRSQKYYHLGCGDQSSKKFKCEQCDKRFSSHSHYKYHMESHASNEYECAECKKTFCNRIVLRKHQKMHDAQPLSCKECGKTYRFAESLAAHMDQHRNNLRHQCNICDKRYAGKSTLHQHMLKHQAKMHVCPVCKKRFQRNSTMKSHLKRHSKTERHECPVCQRQFSDAAAQLRHCKMHKETVKFKCRHCDITTIRKDNMLRHVRNIHIGESFDSCVEMVVPSFEIDPIAEPANAAEPLLDPTPVRNISVIKCIGNVAPVQIGAEDKDEVQKEEEEKPPEPVAKQKKVKLKYNPIEMYRRILISDEDDEGDDDSNQQTGANVKDALSTVTETLPTVSTSDQQRASVNTPSNFSEMHWRKNYKYTYQFQDF